MENSFRIENLLYFSKGHQLEFGGGFYNNEAKIGFDTNINDTLFINTLNRYRNSRLYAFADNYLPVGYRLTLKTGGRLIVSTNDDKVYFEPRLSSSYKLSEQLKIDAFWGRYHQFISKIASV